MGDRKNLFYLTFRVGAGIVLSSATMLIVPRFISPDEMGYVAFALGIHAFLMVTCEGGFRLYAIRTDLKSHPLLIGSLLINQITHVVVALVLVAVGWGICYFFSAGTWVQSLPLAFLMLFFQPFYFRRQLATVGLERELKFKIIGAIEIIENICYNSVLLLSVWASFGVWSFVFAHAVRCLVGFIQAQRFPIIWPRFTEHKWLSPVILDAYRYGFSLQGIQWTHNLRGMVTNSLIVCFTNPYSLGLYDRSLLIGNAPLGLFQGVSERFFFAYVSKNYKSDPARCNQAISKAIRYIGWMDKVVYLALFFVGLPLLLHFWGEKWQPVERLVPIVMLGSGLFGSLSFPTYPLQTATAQTGFLFKMALLAFGLTVTAGPILLRFFGIAGACWLGVLLWGFAFLGIANARKIMGTFKWVGSWITSSAIAIALYFFIKQFITIF